VTDGQDPKRLNSSVNLALDGNDFSALAVLQYAQLHLMRSSGTDAALLTVSLDGDFQAILKLQCAVDNLLCEVMKKHYLLGYNEAIRLFATDRGDLQ
jgi:hypothetical protein